MKPILFNTEMVKAILNDKKTITRRVVKDSGGNTPQSCKRDKFYKQVDKLNNDMRPYVGFYKDSDVFYIGEEKHIDAIYFKQPYQVGDILYVREAWWKNNGRYYYLADYDLPELVKKQLSKDCKCRPSIHMPKEAARIFLRVTNVRVERLQDIGSLDVFKEGVKPQVPQYDGRFEDFKIEFSEAYNNVQKACKDAFHKLWDSTIKKSELDRYGWNCNPWVFVYEFVRCEKPVEEVKE